MTPMPATRGAPSPVVLDLTAWALYCGALLAPNLALFAVERDARAALFLVAAFLLFCAWHYGLRWSRTAVVLLLPAFVLLPFELYFLLVYHEIPGPQVIAIALQTPTDQVRDYLAERAIPIALLAFASLAIWVWAVRRAPFGQATAGSRPVLRWAGIAILAGAAWFASVRVMAAFQASEVEFSGAASQPAEIENGVSARLIAEGLVQGAFPFGRLLILSAYAREVKAMRYFDQARERFRFDARQAAPADVPETIVMVIGESSAASRWGLFGYHRDTTPRLAARAGLVPIPDLVTPFSFTLGAVPAMLTRKPTIDKRLHYEEPSIVSLFREAGFETHWLSNQGRAGSYDYSIARIADEAEHVAYVSAAGALRPGLPGDDADLLPLLANATARPARAKLIVLHTQGSHSLFWERYPAGFGPFQPALDRLVVGGFRDPDYAERIGNAYDNAIAYTDHMLDRMIAQLDTLPGRVALVFVADHGVQLPTPGCGSGGHGFGSRNVFHVPGFVWLNERFATDRPGLVARLRETAALPGITSSVFPTLADLAAITYRAPERGTSLLDDPYRPGTRYVLGEFGRLIDFDQADVDGACGWVRERTTAAAPVAADAAPSR